MGIIRLQHNIDPKAVIMEKMEPFLDGMGVMGEDILLGVYDRDAYKSEVKSAGGIIIANTKLSEDKYQGLSCLVLKMGPLAFVEDDEHTYGPTKPKVGDWVAVRKSEGFSFVVGSSSKMTDNQQCRLMNERGVRLIISDPDSVW